MNQITMHSTFADEMMSDSDRYAMEQNGVARMTLFDLSPLNVLVELLKARYNPVYIWLFGSRSRGTNRPDSDWDIMLVLDDDAPEEDMDLLEAHRQGRASGVSADVLPCRLSEFFEDASVHCTIAYEVARNGVLLYEQSWKVHRQPALACA